MDLDLNKKGITIIGISNSASNVSKIKRALILSVPDLSESLYDLKLTSISIGESINEDFGTKNIFKNMN